MHTIHANFDESGPLAAMELKQLELHKLAKRMELSFDYSSRLANSIPELVFYPEPPELLQKDKEEEGEEIVAIDKFLGEYNIDELRDARGNLPNLAHYVGSRPQALTICASDSKTKKQADDDILVAMENMANKELLSDILQLSVHPEPRIYSEAMSCIDKIHWCAAIKKEGDSLVAHGTWDFVPPPLGMRALTTKWIFKKKYDANGKIERYKARLFIRGFEQIKIVDFEEIFTPVIRLGSSGHIRLGVWPDGRGHSVPVW